MRFTIKITTNKGTIFTVIDAENERDAITKTETKYKKNGYDIEETIVIKSPKNHAI